MSSSDQRAEARQEFLRVATELAGTIVQASFSQLSKGLSKGVTTYEIGIGVSGFVEKVLEYSDGDTQVAESLVSEATQRAGEMLASDLKVDHVAVQPDAHAVPIPGRESRFVVNAYA